MPKGSNFKKKRLDNRSRVWTCLFYPDSLPKDWKEKLESLVLPVAVSPLHDKDLYEIDDVDELPDGEIVTSHTRGELKKPHYHVVVSFSGKKSYAQVLNVFQPFGVATVQVCGSLFSLLRYFVHLDNPEKAQYDKKEILAFGGLSVDKAFRLARDDYSSVVPELLFIINQNGIKEFSTFVDIVAECKPEWVDVIVSKTNFFRAYLDSMRFGGNKK